MNLVTWATWVIWVTSAISDSVYPHHPYDAKECRGRKASSIWQMSLNVVRKKDMLFPPQPGNLPGDCLIWSFKPQAKSYPLQDPGHYLRYEALTPNSDKDQSVHTYHMGH